MKAIHLRTKYLKNPLGLGITGPEEGVFNFEPTDQIVNYAHENNLALRAHAPVWHNMNADCTFMDGEKPASREKMIGDVLKGSSAKIEAKYQVKAKRITE